MEPRQTALVAFLRALGVPEAIDSLEDRKRVQKAVYLGQIAGGVNLGYRYGWYVHGPYSPALTQDYFAIEEAQQLGETIDTSVRLPRPLSERLAATAPLMEPEPNSGLGQADWLELLASIYYQHKYLGKSLEDTRAIIDAKKAHISGHFDLGVKALRDAGLLD